MNLILFGEIMKILRFFRAEEMCAVDLSKSNIDFSIPPTYVHFNFIDFYFENENQLDKILSIKHEIRKKLGIFYVELIYADADPVIPHSVLRKLIDLGLIIRIEN
jgi:hypothetical protein